MTRQKGPLLLPAMLVAGISATASAQQPPHGGGGRPAAATAAPPAAPPFAPGPPIAAPRHARPGGRTAFRTGAAHGSAADVRAADVGAAHVSAANGAKNGTSYGTAAH